MIVLAAAIAASAIDMAKAEPLKPHTITISISKSEDVIITMDGKPITCPQLDAYLASTDKNRVVGAEAAPHRHVIGFDCEKLEFKTAP